MNILSCLETVTVKIRDIRENVRHAAVTAVLMVFGAIVMLCAAGFTLAAAYMWLDTRLSGPAAALCVAGGLVIVGLLIFAVANLRRRQRRGVPQTRAQSQPAMRETQELADLATRELLAKVRKSPGTAALTAVALGVVVGLLRPHDQD